MKCSKLMKEALEGIDFRYKLDDTLAAIDPKARMTGTQLRGYLQKRGVSPKEIDQSGMFNVPDTEALPINMWREEVETYGKHRLTDIDGGREYDNITLGGKGVDNKSYKETLTTIREPRENAPEMPHYGREVIEGNYRPAATDGVRSKTNIPQTLLGWKREHIDNIAGKDTTVLNEFQSDWLQTERAGRGTFKRNMLGSEETRLVRFKALKFLEEGDAKGLEPMFDKYLVMGDNHPAASALHDLRYNPNDAEAKARLRRHINDFETQFTANFPMSDRSFHKYQIVKGIDKAIQNGTNRVAIPIQREGELAGGEGVTKFYDSLGSYDSKGNIKMFNDKGKPSKTPLAEIKRKLEKEKMKVTISKEDYKGQIDIEGLRDLYGEEGLSIYEALDNYIAKTGVAKDKVWESPGIIEFLITEQKARIASLPANNIEARRAKLIIKGLEARSGTNQLHVIDIVPVKGKKVPWDIYSLLGAVGLGSLAEEMKEEPTEQ